jgi:hypothetical protein
MAAETVSNTRSVSRGVTVGRRSHPGESLALKVNVTHHALISRDGDMHKPTDIELQKSESSSSMSPRGDMFVA